MEPFLLLLLLSPLAHAAQDSAFAPEPETVQLPSSQVRFVQHPGAQLPLNLRFHDETGASVPLRSYFGRQPVLLSFAYYRCPNLCTLVLNGLVQAMRASTLGLGSDYQAVTISIDPRETPALAEAKRRSYLARLGKPELRSSWHFLTGDEQTIRTLADAAGFHYSYDPVSREYLHPSGALVVTPKGRISRYFFGIQFSPTLLSAALRDASRSRIGTIVDEVLLFCFHYDPKDSRVGAIALFWIRAIGALFAIALAIYLVVALRQSHLNRARRERA